MNAALTAQLRHVVDALVADEAPDYTVNGARSTMAVIDAAYRSAASWVLAEPA